MTTFGAWRIFAPEMTSGSVTVSAATDSALWRDFIKDAARLAAEQGSSPYTVYVSASVAEALRRAHERRKLDEARDRARLAMYAKNTRTSQRVARARRVVAKYGVRTRV